MDSLNEEYDPAVPLDALIELVDNPRRGDLALLNESVTEIGFYGAVIVNKATNEVLAGNHRIKALHEQGEETVPVIYVDVDEVTARKIALVDNHANDRATYDVHDLLATIERLDGDFDGTGYTETDYADLLAQTTSDAPTPAPGEDDFGDPDSTGEDSDYWPALHLQVPPGVFAAWGSLVAQKDDEVEAFTFLMEQYAGVSLDDDEDINDALSSLDD